MFSYTKVYTIASPVTTINIVSFDVLYCEIVMMPTTQFLLVV